MDNIFFKMAKDNGRVQPKTFRQWLVAILANTILFSYGLQTGWISSTTATLQSDDSPTGTPLTDSEMAWLGSAPSLAAFASVPLFSWLVNVFGRKYCIVVFGVLQGLSWIIKLSPATTASLIVARICVGMAAGGCFSVVPMYVKEISQDHIRGTLGLLIVLMQYLGLLAMYAMGGYLGYYTVLWIVVGIPILNAVLMIKAPESPTYLVKIGKIEDAASIVAFLRSVSRGEKLVQNEIDALILEDEKFRSVANVSYIGIFKQKAWRKGFVFMILVMIAHGTNGALTIITFASNILRTAGVTIRLDLTSMMIPMFMILSSFLAMGIIDRLGRKILLGGCFAVSVLSNCCLAAVLILQQNGRNVPTWLPVVAIVVSACAYSAGVGSCPFIIMAEMFNFQIRAKVMGVLVTLGWLFCFIQLYGYNLITDHFGAHVAFLCFAGFNLLGMFVTLVLLPETNGKSIEQIEIQLEQNIWRKKKCYG